VLQSVLTVNKASELPLMLRRNQTGRWWNGAGIENGASEVEQYARVGTRDSRLAVGDVTQAQGDVYYSIIERVI
jgi:hypothetical protein